MRTLVATLLLLSSAAAQAGGVGVTATTGVFTDTVYFYDKSTDFTQYKQTQLLTNYGSGLEFVLGDRDDRITGVFRGFWLRDGPEKAPADRQDWISPENVVADVRTESHDLGVATFGVQWGIVGDPNKFQLVALTSAGSGFITNDRREFLLLQAGGGVTFRPDPRVEVFADIDYSMRFRKHWSQGGSMYAGARWLFD